MASRPLPAGGELSLGAERRRLAKEAIDLVDEGTCT